MTYKEDPPEQIEKVINSARSKDIKVKFLTRERLDMFTGGRPHNGLVIKSLPRDYIEIFEFEEFTKKHLIKPKGNLILLLDQIVDPQNIGSIIRSAFFLGTDAILLNRINKPRIDSTVSKVSSGASECSDLFSVNSIQEFLSSAIDSKWTIVTQAIEDEDDIQMWSHLNRNNYAKYTPTYSKIKTKTTPLSDLQLPVYSNIVLVLTSKVSSSPSSLKGLAHYKIYIPPLLESRNIDEGPYNIVNSLNVGTTAGIILNHLKSQLIETK